MYERFYQLRERPFALTPDPDYLYPSRVHSEALSYLRYGIEGHAGFIVITGEVGSGKTTLLQTALRSVDQHTAVARPSASRACCACSPSTSWSNALPGVWRCSSSTRRRT